MDDDNESSDEEWAVASAEEYAVKITKLQQACLIPLKEDLAEWLNKILEMSNITTENFMDKLDNGVIICHLARIITLWCEQQLTPIVLSNANVSISFLWHERGLDLDSDSNLITTTTSTTTSACFVDSFVG